MLALNRIEIVWEQLRQSPQDVVIDAEEALAIYDFFREYAGVKANPASHFNDVSYRSFLQACMIVAIDQSSNFGWIKPFFDSALTPSRSVASIVRKLLSHALKSYYMDKSGDQKLYRSVVKRITLVQKTRFTQLSRGSEIL